MEYNKNLYSAVEAIYKKAEKFEESLLIENDFKKILEINKFLKNNKEIIDIYHEYSQVVDSIINFNIRLKEEKNVEMQDLIKLDFEEATKKVFSLEEKARLLLVPKDDHDDRNIIIEMRPAAGGDEASIFVGNLYEAYVRYANNQNWKVETIEMHNDTHGISFISFIISGENVFSKMKYESGVHRVQRVPATESKGRVHTSTITVAIMPEIEDVEVQINKADIREDRYCASGAGGQHVNKTQSAVRLTHIPSGIVVACQEGKSQHSNRETAFKLLKSKLYDFMLKEQQDLNAAERKSQVGRGNRSEKIRTYNYPQNRVTDHRINFTVNQLDLIMQGNFQDIIEALISNDHAEKMANLSFENDF